jgi:hypothetical protein
MSETLSPPRCVCGEPATANGRECPTHFLARLRSIRVDSASFDTAELHDYYDRDAITDMFGDDAHDAYMDQTNGLGAAYRGPDGYYHKDRKTGDIQRLDARDLDRTFLAGDTEEA